jgi:cobaltochelatase CobS
MTIATTLPDHAAVKALAEIPDDRSGADRREVVRAELKTFKESAGRLAGLLTEVQDGRYWEAWGHDSFEAYVRDECGLALRTAQALVRIFRVFSELKVPAETLAGYDWSKVELAARVVDAGNLAELLADLDRLTYRDLEAKVRTMKHGGAAIPPAPAPHSLAHGTSTAIPAVATASRAARGWRLQPPPDDEFFVSKDVWLQLCFAIEWGRNVLLLGPSGCGKSELTYRAAAAAGRPIEPFNFGAMSEPRTSLIGAVHLDHRRGTSFTPSRFVRAVSTPGSCILLDELNRSGRDAYNILLPLLDNHQGYLALDESEDTTVVRRAPGVTFFATANLGSEYAGTEPLDRALGDRFSIVVALDFPPKEKELALVRSRCPGLGQKDAEQLTEVAARQRELAAEGEFVGSVSTRSLIAAGEQIAAGMSIRDALRFCVLNRFSCEGGDASERTKLLQIFQKIQT